MRRKIIESIKEHQSPLLENGAQVFGISEGYIEESDFHNNFNYDEVTLIGEFSIEYTPEDIFLEDRKIADIIKDGKKTLNYQIYVYGKEGPVPHFHLIEKSENNKQKKTDCCICIFESKYFDHGSHTSILNSKELKILDSFLRSSYNNIITYWQFITVSWDGSNQDNIKKYPQYRTTTTQPDYTNISGFKSNPVGY